MNIHSLVFSGMLTVLAFCVAGASAQQVPQRRPQIPTGGQPGLPGSGQVSGIETRKLLSTNYRILFAGRSGDKSLGELSSLTCAPDVSLLGPLDASAMPASLGVSGRIEERDGGTIIFEYSISFRVPVPAPPVTGGTQQVGNLVSNMTYQDHATSGCLLMKPGQAYEILRAGGTVHTVTIAPERDK